MSRTRTRAAALLGAAFVLGALVGAGGMAVAEHRHAGSHRHGPDEFLHQMTGTLHLTAPQQDSVRQILARHRPAMDSLWRELGPRFETLQGTIRSEIRQQLTPGQQGRFADMNQRFDAMRHTSDSAHAPR